MREKLGPEALIEYIADYYLEQPTQATRINRAAVILPLTYASNTFAFYL